MRIVLVQPICTVDVDEPAAACGTVHASYAAAPKFEANGAILTALAGVIQKLIAAAPTLLPELLQLLALFGAQANPPPPANS